MLIDQIRTIDSSDIEYKRVLLRVDFNVSISKDHTIEDDVRIRQALPTIMHLLNKKCRLVIVSHLGRPKERDDMYSMRVVVDKLKDYIPHYDIQLVPDFVTDRSSIDHMNEGQIMVLENIRFYPGEKHNDPDFAQKLASLGDVYVNDGFGVSHRDAASVTGVTNHLPSYAGLLMKKEIENISGLLDKPRHPFTAILGGAKISTKIHLIERLVEMTDYIVLGGGLANTFMLAQGYEIGKSIGEKDSIDIARKMLFDAVQKNTRIIFPSDVVVSNSMNGGATEVIPIMKVTPEKYILDIGPATQANIGSIIAKSGTIVWNGPVGYFENAAFKRGTDYIYYSIAANTEATTILGGGDTLAAISKKEHLDAITHISTGGGAMLEFIENGTLPGIEALKVS